MADHTHTIKCRCPDRSHVVLLDYVDDSYGEVSIQPALNHSLPFRKRLVVGIKYILGIDNTHSHYTEVLMDLSAIRRLRAFIHKVEEEIETNNRISKGLQKDAA